MFRDNPKNNWGFWVCAMVPSTHPSRLHETFSLKNWGAFFVSVENFQWVTVNERDFMIFSPKLGEILNFDLLLSLEISK
jgi:hypothetical protein